MKIPLFKKAIFRYRQFGGWRMLRAYAKMGVLPTLSKEVVRVLRQRLPLKDIYPAVRQKIAPVLWKQYKPLVQQLVGKYDALSLEHVKNDVVWFCWLQGIEKAPELVKVCLASQKRFIRGKKFVIITSTNYRDYVELPAYIETMHQKGIIPAAHFTDLIRLEILIKHGGTWIDSTVLCSGSDYLDEIMDCNLFFFQYKRKGNEGFAGISNWFISAYSNNKLLMILRDMLLQYWKDYDCLMDYYIFHLFFGLIAEKFPEEIAKMPKANSMRAIQMMQYLDKAFDVKLMEQLTAISCFHKLDYRKNTLQTKENKETFYSIKMKIAFVSTRGIPNNYGGFEQFAEYISVGLAKRGHDVTVYSPHYHPYQAKIYGGVKIKHIYSPEQWMGSSLGSFFYDYACLKDALKKENFDIIYEAGYTSIIPAYIRFNVKDIKKPVFITNMDGLEYKRTKFNPLVQKFIFWEEKMAVKHSHYLVADNMGIHDYYKEKYGKDSKCLAYGADIHENWNISFLQEYGLEACNYYLIIARLEPENNLVMAIEGYLKSKEKGSRPLVIVGKTDTPHGKYIVKKYGHEDSILFMGGIYDFQKLDSVRHFSHAYFHGHSVGGTNPSLLEAMASGCFILANDNVFNRAVLKENALYYNTADDVCEILDRVDDEICERRDTMIRKNMEEIKTVYSWEKLIDEHEKYFNWLLNQKK